MKNVELLLLNYGDSVFIGEFLFLFSTDVFYFYEIESRKVYISGLYYSYYSPENAGARDSYDLAATKLPVLLTDDEELELHSSSSSGPLPKSN